MIIKCEKCQTKFRLDDSRVTDRGVKVRCTKCKHVFVVRKEEPAEESFASFAPAADSPLSSATPENESFPVEPASDIPFEQEASEDTCPGSEAEDFSLLETASSDDAPVSMDSDSFQSFATEDNPAPAAEPLSGEVDFSSFDFGDSDSSPDVPLQSSPAVDAFASVTTPKEARSGLDFSDDDMFGAVVQAAPEPTAETITFDFEGDSFADSMVMGGQEPSGKSSTLFSLDSPGDAPFSLGEIDFGDELTSVAVQQVNPEDLKPSQELLFAPLASAQDKSRDDEIKRSFLGDVSAGALQEELPPLSIASRRKQSPLFGALIGVIALLVVSALAYLGYSSFYAPKESAVQESGGIVVRSVKAVYDDNEAAGELLVISGEAVNGYPKPRAALQVKVTVFNASGQVIANKSAYAGNPLTEEQLESLPLDKIESAMGNQFGDSLANMEVAPGKSIPFVVVLANLPKGAKDFSVEAAGSTVATGKQP